MGAMTSDRHGAIASNWRGMTQWQATGAV